MAVRSQRGHLRLGVHIDAANLWQQQQHGVGANGRLPKPRPRTCPSVWLTTSKLLCSGQN